MIRRAGSDRHRRQPADRRSAGRRPARRRAAARRGAAGHPARRRRPTSRPWIKDDAAELAQVAEKPRRDARRCTRRASSSRRPRRSTFAEDGIMVRDGGATVIFQWTYSQAKPRDVIWNQNFGHLGTGSAVRRRRLGRRGPQAAGHAADQRLGIPVPHRRTGDRGAGRTCRWSASWASTISGASRSASTSARSSSRHRSPVCTGARTCASTRSPRASAATVSTSRRRTRSVRRSSGPIASGKTAVVHVCIDPTANSEEMPKYDEIPDLVCRRHSVEEG